MCCVQNVRLLLVFVNDGSSHFYTHEEILPLKYFILHDEASIVSKLVSAQFRDPFVYNFHCLSDTSQVQFF